MVDIICTVTSIKLTTPIAAQTYNLGDSEKEIAKPVKAGYTIVPSICASVATIFV